MSAEFAYLSQFLKQRSGLDLSADKQYLLDSRLRPIARRHGLADVSALVAALKQPGSTELGEEVVEAMTTNESFFFRDKTPFDQFRDSIIPELLPARGSARKLRIWCAAASTGQEPYSLGMELREMQSKLANWSIDIIGTDLSPQVLEKARAGIYSQFEVQRGLPVQMLVKYFEQKGEMWQLSPQIRAMVNFRVHNLLEDFSNLGKFDIIFCRNVLIYFDTATKSDVLKRIRRQLASDGFLVLGASETIIGLTDEFELVPGSRGLYRPKGEARSEAPRMVAAGGGAPLSATSRAPSPTGLVQAGQRPSSYASPNGAAPATTPKPSFTTQPTSSPQSPAAPTARGTGGIGGTGLGAVRPTVPGNSNAAGGGYRADSKPAGAVPRPGTTPRPTAVGQRPSSITSLAEARDKLGSVGQVGGKPVQSAAENRDMRFTASPASMRQAPPPPSPSRSIGVPPIKPDAGAGATPRPNPTFKPKD